MRRQWAGVVEVREPRRDSRRLRGGRVLGTSVCVQIGVLRRGGVAGL